MSRFERELGDTPRILGSFDTGGGVHNEAYARYLGFLDASDMDRFCMSRDVTPWLSASRANRLGRSA
jgi:hypothetical protein